LRWPPPLSTADDWQHTTQLSDTGTTSSSTPSSSSRNPRQLTGSILKAPSPSTLLKILKRGQDDLDEGHVACLISSCARLHAAAAGAAAATAAAAAGAPLEQEPKQQQDQQQQLNELRAPLLLLVARYAQHMAPRELAATLNGLGAMRWAEKRALRQLLSAVQRCLVAEEAEDKQRAAAAASDGGSSAQQEQHEQLQGQRPRSQQQPFTPQGLALALNGCARLDLRPSAEFMGAWCRALKRREAACNARDLGMVFWALGRLGYRPSHGWVQRVAARSAAVSAASSPLDLVNTLWGVASMDLRPMGYGAWLHAAIVQLRPHLHALQARELAALAWAMGRMRFKPGDAWLADFVAAAEAARRSGRLRGRECVLMLWGLVRLGRDAVVGDLLMDLQRTVAGGQAAGGAAAVEGSSADNSGDSQHKHEQQQAEQQQQQRPGALPLDRTDSMMALLSLSELARSRIHVPFIDHALEAARAHLPTLTPHELAQAAFALGRCRYRPPPRWAAAFLDACVDAAHGMGERELAMLLFGVTRLQVRSLRRLLWSSVVCTRATLLPDSPFHLTASHLVSQPNALHLPRQLSPGLTWTAEILAEADEQLDTFKPHSLANMLFALGRMGVKPNKEWMGAVLQRAYKLLK